MYVPVYVKNNLVGIENCFVKIENCVNRDSKLADSAENRLFD
jgi:hypothetical protein